MPRLLLLSALSLSLAACQTDSGVDDPVVEEVEVAQNDLGTETPAAVDVIEPFTPAAPAGGTGGVFMAMVAGSQPDTLVSVRSGAAERAEVHETYDAGDGLRGMREVEGGIPLAAGETVALEPGGYHIMLINLAEGTAEGDRVDLELEFSSGAVVPVSVPVVSLGAMPQPSAE